jgi:demethylmenaquinone methyltransferase/2-methoxy-6-polyprenyl-1,4-benzoquinol methylase
MFAAIAGRYDLNNRLHSFGRDQAWRRTAVREAGVRPTEDVLDVACGTGDLTEAFADAGPASVTGVDFTEPMLDVARGKADRRRRSDGVPRPVYAHGDATALEYDDASFDVVSIAFGIRNVSDPAVALAEFRRVLRPGGRLVVLEFCEPTNPVLRGLNRIYTTRVMPVTASWLARDRSGAYRYLPRSVSTFADRRSLAEMMAAAGFADVTQRPLTFGVCVASVGRVPA